MSVYIPKEIKKCIKEFSLHEKTYQLALIFFDGIVSKNLKIELKNMIYSLPDYVLNDTIQVYYAIIQYIYTIQLYYTIVQYKYIIQVYNTIIQSNNSIHLCYRIWMSIVNNYLFMPVLEMRKHA